MARAQSWSTSLSLSYSLALRAASLLIVAPASLQIASQASVLTSSMVVLPLRRCQSAGTAALAAIASSSTEAAGAARARSCCNSGKPGAPACRSRHSRAYCAATRALPSSIRAGAAPISASCRFQQMRPMLQTASGSSLEINFVCRSVKCLKVRRHRSFESAKQS
jgi:hypothetical protein